MNHLSPSTIQENLHTPERRSRVERRNYTLRTMHRCLVSPRRANGRRSLDRQYPVLDVLSGGIISCVLLLVVFSILDAVFTLTLLSRGASELNPVMNYFLTKGPTVFISVKMLLTAVPALILAASGNVMLFNRIRAHSLLAALVGGYAGLLCYEVGMLVVSK